MQWLLAEANDVKRDACVHQSLLGHLCQMSVDVPHAVARCDEDDLLTGRLEAPVECGQIERIHTDVEHF